jgi:hypothetical protein
MTTKQAIDWNDVEAAAKQLAGNWRKFECFVWSRGYDLDDADQWCIWYTSHRDSGLLCQSNEKVISDRLRPFSDGDDPDLVFESHSHWACGHIDGFSIRVFKPDRSITPAFEEFCRIKQDLENYPVLNESDYSDREYETTLENYRSEMWGCRDELPEGWEGKVYSYFSDNGHDEFIENTDDRGGWASREKIIEALQAIGLMPTGVKIIRQRKGLDPL